MKEEILNQRNIYDKAYSNDLCRDYLNQPFFKIIQKRYIDPMIKPKCLNIGCGCKAIKDSINVDISFNALLQSRHINGKYVQADAYNLPFKNNSFDLIISMFCLHHISKIEIVANQIFRLLKKGGTFFAFEEFIPESRWFDFWGLSFLKKKQKKFYKEKINLSHNRHYLKTIEENKKAFNKFVLNAETVVVEYMPTRFYSYEWAFIVSDLLQKIGFKKNRGRFLILKAKKRL